MRSDHAAPPVEARRRRLSGAVAVLALLVVVTSLAAAPSPSYAAAPPTHQARAAATDGAVTAAAPSQPHRPRARGPEARSAAALARAALSPTLRTLLRLVNLARAVPRSCGGVRYQAARPVRANLRLNRAATRYARLLGARDFFSHTSPDGSDPGDRIRAAGYRWRAYGENLAAGFTTPAAAVQGWLDSPGHCQNLMNPTYTEIGLGFARQDGSTYGRYWVQELARPM